MGVGRFKTEQPSGIRTAFAVKGKTKNKNNRKTRATHAFVFDKVFSLCYNNKDNRGVAQFGSALGSGPRGRGFKSRHLDHKNADGRIGRPHFYIFVPIPSSAIKETVRRFLFHFRQIMPVPQCGRGTAGQRSVSDSSTAIFPKERSVLT